MLPQIWNEMRPRLARGVRLQKDAKAGRVALLFPEGILELNEAAEQILTRSDGRTVTEIVGALAEEYEVDRATLELDVHETLVALQERRLLELE